MGWRRVCTRPCGEGPDPHCGGGHHGSPQAPSARLHPAVPKGWHHSAHAYWSVTPTPPSHMQGFLLGLLQLPIGPSLFHIRVISHHETMCLLLPCIACVVYMCIDSKIVLPKFCCQQVFPTTLPSQGQWHTLTATLQPHTSREMLHLPLLYARSLNSIPCCSQETAPPQPVPLPGRPASLAPQTTLPWACQTTCSTCLPPSLPTPAQTRFTPRTLATLMTGQPLAAGPPHPHQPPPPRTVPAQL